MCMLGLGGGGREGHVCMLGLGGREATGPWRLVVQVKRAARDAPRRAGRSPKVQGRRIEGALVVGSVPRRLASERGAAGALVCMLGTCAC